jgi:poly(A) polymerase/tRNA nucleotidyltransferase (CCA-adding enzyme)
VTDPPQAAIPPPGFLARGAPAAVLAALPGARAVGGCVRDALAGREVHDVDVAAPLPPEDIAARLQAAGLKVFETGLKHGTVTAVLDHVPVEVTALRRDVVTDGRHAEVAWTTDWREDAARRDFTINAMSLAADGRLWDYFGGRADLAAGRVRFVGDAATRLAEDYLRALRFFRFWARYGRGDPDAAAIAAIRDAVEGLKRRIAPERIWMELKRLLGAPDPVAALELMAGTGVLEAVLPEARSFDLLRRLVALDAPADPLLRMGALVAADDVAALARRLRLSGEEKSRLEGMLSASPVHGGGPGWGHPAHAVLDRAALARWRATRPRRQALDELWLAEAADGGDRAALRADVEATDAPVFPLLGRDVLAEGAPPGPEVGQMLAAIRDWWLEGGCTATRDDCLGELRRRMGAGAAYGSAAPTDPGRSPPRGT